MSDITMCGDNKCPSRMLCERFCCKPNRLWQSYSNFGRQKGQKRCNSLMLTQEALRKKDKEGIKSQKRILKWLDKRRKK